MSITIKKGKGKGTSYKFSVGFGTITAELTDEHKDMTITEFAEALLKQQNVTNGEIELIGIEFKLTKANE